MTLPALGVFLPSMSPPGHEPGDVVASARHAEELGFESVWVVDQLIAGSGSPFIDSVVALSAAASATSRVRLGFGVVILPLHSVVWVAKQVASLQHISGDRVLLGVGAGGDRHDAAWAAAGVRRAERGRRTDAALRLLPSLIAGQPTLLPGDGPTIQLSPGATVPPILVGGMSDAAFERTLAFADEWFLLPAPADAVASAVARLEVRAALLGRPRPAVTASLMTAFVDDPALPDQADLTRLLTDADGMYGVPVDQIPNVLFQGTPDALAERLAAFAAAGATRVVASIVAGDWYRQTQQLAAAQALRT